MVNMLREVSQIATLLLELHLFPALTTGCSLVRRTELQYAAPAGTTSGVYETDKFF
jgi:hypothetical protein